MNNEKIRDECAAAILPVADIINKYTREGSVQREQATLKLTEAILWTIAAIGTEASDFNVDEVFDPDQGGS